MVDAQSDDPGVGDIGEGQIVEVEGPEEAEEEGGGLLAIAMDPQEGNIAEQPVGETMEDFIDQVEELPLDGDEEENGLATVVEDPEMEAKEQEYLLNDTNEEPSEGHEDPGVVDEPFETEQRPLEDSALVEGPQTGEQSASDAALAVTEELDAAQERGRIKEEDDLVVSECPASKDESASEVADGSCISKEEGNGDQTEESHKESTQAQEEIEIHEIRESVSLEVDETKDADVVSLGTEQENFEPNLEKSSPEMTANEDTAIESQEQSVPLDVQEEKTSTEQGESSKGETKVDEVRGDGADKKKKKKKRKKSKSTEGSRITKETGKPTKPSLTMHGGFSCGWVGPMLQLLGTMKKLDEFKECYARKYPEDKGSQTDENIIGKILSHAGHALARTIIKARAHIECHGKRYTPRGHQYGEPTEFIEAKTPKENTESAVTSSIIPESVIRPSDPEEGCPRCGGAVFEAERMKSRFRSYHKPCFNCKACHRTLDSTKACDGPDRDVYCRLCYSKKYGPKGYGFGGGAAFLQTDIITCEAPGAKPEWVKLDRTRIKPTDGVGCPRCGGAVFAAELMLSKGQEWHISCFNCRDCKRPLDSTIACDGPDKEIYCKVDYGRRFGPRGVGFGRAPTLVSFNDDVGMLSPDQAPPVRKLSMGPKAPPGEGCPRCGFHVFAAEMMMHNNRTYHRHCFVCYECNHTLDSTNLCGSPEGELLCKVCYGRQHGPKGVGYGQGAGILTMG